MDLSENLRRTFLFESFSHDEMKMLSFAVSQRKVRKGEEVFSEGTEADAFYLIIAGRLKVHRFSQAGKEQVLHVHGAGELVAEAAIFDSMDYPASCTALEESTLIRIDRIPFVRALKENASLALKLLGAYSKRLRQFVAKVEELSNKDVRTRLAGYLLHHSQPRKGHAVCRLECSKKELASFLGTVPETLSRALAELKEKGMIDERGETIILTDTERLRQLAS